MRALVTGIAGFIGSTLAIELSDKGWDVCGIDSLTTYYDPELKQQNLALVHKLAPRATWQIDDLTTCDLDSLLEGVDVVFHQAGQPGVRKSWGQDFGAYVTANIDATQRLLEAVTRKRHLTRFVYASSSSVYGNAATYPTTEQSLPAPMSPYGVTKLTAEHLVSLYAKNFGTPTTSLRYFTVYGPRQRPDMAFTRFLKAAHGGSKIVIYGDGTQVRDFTFVNDIAAANILAATSDTEPGRVFNVSGGSSVSVNEVLETVQGLAERPLNIEYGPRVPGDVFQTGGDSRAIRSELGWTPKVSLDMGLAFQSDWVRQSLDRAATLSS